MQNHLSSPYCLRCWAQPLLPVLWPPFCPSVLQSQGPPEGAGDCCAGDDDGVGGGDGGERGGSGCSETGGAHTPPPTQLRHLAPSASLAAELAPPRGPALVLPPLWHTALPLSLVQPLLLISAVESKSHHPPHAQSPPGRREHGKRPPVQAEGPQTEAAGGSSGHRRGAAGGRGNR